jgi:hypothetical protein
LLPNTTFPLSTAELEHVAADVAGEKIMATNNLLVELNYPQQHNVPLYEDNEACINETHKTQNNMNHTK